MILNISVHGLLFCWFWVCSTAAYVRAKPFTHSQKANRRCDQGVTTLLKVVSPVNSRFPTRPHLYKVVPSPKGWWLNLQPRDLWETLEIQCTITSILQQNPCYFICMYVYFMHIGGTLCCFLFQNKFEYIKSFYIFSVSLSLHMFLPLDIFLIQETMCFCARCLFPEKSKQHMF